MYIVMHHRCVVYPRSPALLACFIDEMQAHPMNLISWWQRRLITSENGLIIVHTKIIYWTCKRLSQRSWIPFVRAVMQESPVISKSKPASYLKTSPAWYTPYATVTNAPHLLRLSLFLIAELSSSLLHNSLLLSLTGSLGLRTLGIHFLLKNSLTRLLSLSSVNLIAVLVDGPLWVLINLRAQPMLACAWRCYPC